MKKDIMNTLPPLPSRYTTYHNVPRIAVGLGQIDFVARNDAKRRSDWYGQPLVEENVIPLGPEDETFFDTRLYGIITGGYKARPAHVEY